MSTQKGKGKKYSYHPKGIYIYTYTKINLLHYTIAFVPDTDSTDSNDEYKDQV